MGINNIDQCIKNDNENDLDDLVEMMMMLIPGGPLPPPNSGNNH